MKHPVLITVLAVLIAANIVFVLMLLTKDAPDKGHIPAAYLPRVTVATVPPPAKTRQFKALGVVAEKTGVPITATVGGRIAKVFVKEGQVVKAGEALLQLDDAQDRLAYQNLQVEWSMAQADVQLAGMNHELPSSAIAIKAMPGATESLEVTVPALAIESDTKHAGEAKSHLEKLTDALRALEKRLEASTVVAPRGGKIVRLTAQGNAMIQPQAVLGEIGTRRYPQIVAQVPASILPTLKAGQTVLLRLPSQFTHQNLQGSIQSFQSPEAVEAQLGWVRIDLAPQSAHLVKAGQSVTVVLEVPGTGSIWIPTQAIQFRQGEAQVFVVMTAKDHTWVLARKVVTGESTETMTEILGGLDAGETIVLEGANLLKQKQQVAVVGTGMREP